MRNASVQETPLVGEALRSIAALLPASWMIDEQAGVRSGERRLDAVVDLFAPNGHRISFAVEAKRSGTVSTALLLTGLRELRRQTSLSVLFVSDYVGPGLRLDLAKEGISYADATGWVRVTSEDPLVLLTGRGAATSPKPGRPGAIQRFNGVAANRTIRALTTTALPIRVRELADLAGVSAGSVSKLLVTLAAESIVDRDDHGGVVAVRRRVLIQRWIRDYTFAKANRSVGYYIAPRGLERTLTSLDGSDMSVALTGSAAARRLLPDGTTSVVPLRIVAIYAAAPGALVRRLGLIEADAGTANVVLAAPQDAQILGRADGKLPLAPPPLVLADLLTLPNRSEAEADQLMEALARDHAAWKE